MISTIYLFVTLTINFQLAFTSTSTSNNSKVVIVPLTAVPFGFENIYNPPVPYYVNHTTATSTSSVNIQTPLPGPGSIYDLDAKLEATNPSKFENASLPGICCVVVLERSAPSTYNSSTHSNVPNPSSYTGSYASSNNPMTGLLEISPTISNFTRAAFADIVNYHDGSIAISPLYIQSQLALLSLAARGKTAQIMRKRLYLNGLSSIEVEGLFESVLEPLETISGLNKASGIFISDIYDISPSYQDTASNYFYSPIMSTNFQNGDEVTQSINNWVANMTDDYINHINTPSIDKSTSLIVVNAVYFYDLWKHEFATASIQLMNFYTNGFCLRKNSKTLSGVSDISHFRCGPVEDLNARVLEFPYRNSDMTMFLLLPNECDGIANVLERLRTFDVNKLRGQKYAWVGVTMPLFNIEYSLNLNGALEKMGLGDILTPAANFDGMTIALNSFSPTKFSTSSYYKSLPPLYVSEFVHKVSINMTETAAFAYHLNIAEGERQRFMGLGPELTSADAWLTYEFDRPFVFLITTPDDVVVIGKFMG